MKEPRPIRAITLIQPWASLICNGPKPLENRSWKPYGIARGDFLAIHAGGWSGLKTEQEWDSALQLATRHGLLSSIDVLAGLRAVVDGERGRLFKQRCVNYCKGAVPYGGVIGVARLDEVRTVARTQGGVADPWFFGPFGWYLSEITPIEPVACAGAQKLWEMKQDVLDVVRARYIAARKERSAKTR